MAATASPAFNLITRAIPISQGAEAKVYKVFLHEKADEPILVKHRFAKQYRHPTLDGNLTKARVAGEARTLLKCLRSGVNVPGVRMVEAADGVLGIEWIDGMSVRKLLPGGAEDEGAEFAGEDEEVDEEEEVDPLLEFGLTVDELMGVIGTEIAKMHGVDVVHGDLTTSNMMLRRGKKGDLVLIDFGLSYQSTLVEDKAVDLYVLERAFASTHPDSEPLFASVLAAYARQAGKAWKAVEKRLEDVRLRGRKRSMVG
ncbi:kinase-like domain-containing protein [Schizophyllum amplum]|uniref:EKC/KEOPS complex subunit BUD32 n=1 Tax=Schizophyllum amplum TaxID=97359 RepID=A0A550CPC5_9AGAR|nr:kinase-like domain-containing protein [Auriculariopsis ampla]